MILEDVEALIPPHYDPAAPPSFEARAVRIATSAGIVRTPDRALTRSEHTARSEVPLSRALPAGLAADFRLLDQKDTRGLVQDGRVAEGIIRSARQFNSCTRRAALRVAVVQPPQASLDAMTHEEKIRFADAQADIFRTNLDAEIIAYPYMGFGASDYIDFIARRSRRDGSCTAMFALDMQMSPPALDKVLGHLGSTRQPTIVPLRHRSPDRTVAQHLILARHLESPRMAFLACQVPRIDYIRGQAVSNLHTVSARYGYDMVALEQRRPAPSSPRALDLNRIVFYSRSGLRIDTVRDALAQRGAGLLGEFHLNRSNERDRRHVAYLLQTIDRAAADPSRFRKLVYLSRVHEALNSPREFARMRDMMTSRLLGEYLSQTVVGHAHMPPPADPAQTLVTDYAAAV